MKFWEFSAINRIENKKRRIVEYNNNPKRCLMCNSNISYEKRYRNYCSRRCANSDNKTSIRKSNYVLESINWNRVQKIFNNGCLIGELPKRIKVSKSTIRKAIKLGLFNATENNLHKKKRSRIASRKMKKCYKKGNHIGWGIVNSKAKRSYPEEFFANALKNNGMYEKYTIIEKLQVSKYTLDFVFVELKLDIEIDGQQHFRTHKAILHDRLRDKFLTGIGWKIYRIAWVEMINNPRAEIVKFISYIDDIKNNTSRFYDISQVVDRVCKRKYGSMSDYRERQREVLLKKNKPNIKLVLNSGVDFSKFGWVRKVSIILDMKEQKVNRWMKRYMPIFYQEKCFKRNRVMPA